MGTRQDLMLGQEQTCLENDSEDRRLLLLLESLEGDETSEKDEETSACTSSERCDASFLEITHRSSDHQEHPVRDSEAEIVHLLILLVLDVECCGEMVWFLCPND